jgi:hypothetical protein
MRKMAEEVPSTPSPDKEDFPKNNPKADKKKPGDDNSCGC